MEVPSRSFRSGSESESAFHRGFLDSIPAPNSIGVRVNIFVSSCHRLFSIPIPIPIPIPIFKLAEGVLLKGKFPKSGEERESIISFAFFAASRVASWPELAAFGGWCEELLQDILHSGGCLFTIAVFSGQRVRST
jgi:hypothetical protein